MTRVEIHLTSDNQLDINYQIDLSRQFPSRADYYATSQLEKPLADPAISALAREILEATVISTASGPITPKWHIHIFIPEAATEAQYQDPFYWPMTRIEASAALPTLPSMLNVSFAPSFSFEEPIATTLRDLKNSIRMTRWLVVEQRSPNFVIADSAAGSASALSKTREPDDNLSLISYLSLGFAHILPDGPDHILFVVLIVLLCTTWQQTALAISLFTLAHAVTLTITILRWFVPPTAYVEWLILASIVWLALDVLRRSRLSWTHCAGIFGFGLVHGMGFASALRELTLPAVGLWQMLVAINLGVEVAQLAVAVVMILILVLHAKFLPHVLTFRTGLAAAALVITGYWIVLRL